ncbi:SDR family oxidoreductase [Dyadobacter sp. CY323]|uniref:SDR family oxidoreductase n=1 Tax=Dyadobacter sp. CY323 TaxID=2907302 RepID=UPI001F44D746|nr:SDR family oxidoreductase [Dyadobacter sp. CY323]MCE6992011.1 SDR family oxidoreductase [Dyadobacter sp. CY323]
MSDSKSPKILITGATGTIGMELVKYLSAKEIPFKAMVRSLEKASELTAISGAEVVLGDFNDTNSLENALNGIERVFLLTNSSEQAEEQQLRFVDAALKSGVTHIVKLSQWASEAHSPVRFLRYHAVVEQKIRESGMKFTFLRPNLFMQGLLGFKDLIKYQGQFFGAIGDAKISLIDTRDIAAAAGESLIDRKHENKTYNLTGPEALSHYEMADKLSLATGKNILFVDVPSDALRETLIHAGFPEWQADGLVEDYAHYKRGEAAEIAKGVFESTGAEPRSFDAFATDYATLFR